MIGFYVLSVGLGIFYAGLFSYFIKGWNKLKFSDQAIQTPATLFTIIVPARNEETNIEKCLNSISAQLYPTELVEIIIADDFSNDGTVDAVNKWISQHLAAKARLIQLESLGRTGKKKAIEFGIKEANTEWIITTDADCTHSPKWLSTLDSFIQRNNPDLISGPVRFSGDKTFFEKAVSLEFIGLIGIGASSIALENPNMCNGANLAYRKSVFYDVKGFSGNDNLASGDDEFLMHKIFLRNPKSVKFITDRNAMVTTPPPASLREFMNQRKRWVSKSTQYSRKKITIVLMLAYLFNLFIILSLIAGVFDSRFIICFLILLMSKIVPEWLFLEKVTRSLDQKRLMKVFFQGSLLHVLYVIVIGIYGNFGRYEWKGRMVK